MYQSAEHGNIVMCWYNTSFATHRIPMVSKVEGHLKQKGCGLFLNSKNHKKKKRTSIIQIHDKLNDMVVVVWSWCKNSSLNSGDAVKILSNSDDDGYGERWLVGGGGGLLFVVLFFLSCQNQGLVDLTTECMSYRHMSFWWGNDLTWVLAEHRIIVMAKVNEWRLLIINFLFSQRYITLCSMVVLNAEWWPW